jgi:hypothetical protein
MEGSMIFCQKNVLEYSMSFHGDCKKRCILTTGVSQIMQFTKLISQKSRFWQKDFSLPPVHLYLEIISVFVEHVGDELDLLTGEPEARFLLLKFEIISGFFLQNSNHFCLRLFCLRELKENNLFQAFFSWLQQWLYSNL